MASGPFIQVILPLRLEWEPYYELEGAKVGDRVKVEFAHREYIGVVSAVNVKPAVEKILPAAPSGLPPIFPQEIAFWRTLAQYYLCTPGEVFKAAYPSVLRRGKPRKEWAPCGKEPLPAGSPEGMEEVLEGFRRQKTVLVEGSSQDLCLELAGRTLRSGKSVLYLVPEITLSSQMEKRIRARFPDLLLYHSGRTTGTRRTIAAAVREQAATLVVGTRSALFLPHHNLGLIIVDEEQDPSFKQDSPAPRYHARESAIFLAGIHGAHVLLCSPTPSLESLYNAETGLFVKVKLKENVISPKVLLIHTSSEARKKGMVGSFSLKLLEPVKKALDAGEKVQLICPSKASVQGFEEEFRGIFPQAPDDAVAFSTPTSARLLPPFQVVAVLQADALLSREDFRADEKALQLLRQLSARSRLLVVQTREPGHPVFKALESGGNGLAFLEERRSVSYPPFSRMIHVAIRDKNEKRADFLSALLARELAFLPSVTGPFSPSQDTEAPEQVRCIRLLFPRDRQLKERKQALVTVINSFEKARKYQGHITIDVDPV